jgi:hypothetical protein
VNSCWIASNDNTHSSSFAIFLARLMLSGLVGASGVAASESISSSALIGASAEVLADMRRVSQMTIELWESH